MKHNVVVVCQSLSKMIHTTSDRQCRLTKAKIHQQQNLYAEVRLNFEHTNKIGNQLHWKYGVSKAASKRFPLNEMT